MFFIENVEIDDNKVQVYFSILRYKCSWVSDSLC